MRRQEGRCRPRERPLLTLRSHNRQEPTRACPGIRPSSFVKVKTRPLLLLLPKVSSFWSEAHDSSKERAIRSHCKKVLIVCDLVSLETIATTPTHFPNPALIR